MAVRDLSEARDPDIRNSLAALRRAALRAREEAIRTNTHLVYLLDGHVVRVDPRKPAEQETN